MVRTDKGSSKTISLQNNELGEQISDEKLIDEICARLDRAGLIKMLDLLRRMAEMEKLLKLE